MCAGAADTISGSLGNKGKIREYQKICILQMQKGKSFCVLEIYTFYLIFRQQGQEGPK